MLNCLGSHTGAAISECITDMLKEWEIPKSSVHAVVSDNAANVIAGMRLAEVPSLGCAIHTLQLVVNAGLKSQRSISDAIARARKIVGHFGHSSLAKERFKVTNVLNIL